MTRASDSVGGRTTSEVRVEDVKDAVKRFAGWLEHSGYATYDPYDVWGTRYGRAARRLYYEKRSLGKIMTAPLLLMEIVSPGLRALMVKRDRFPTADAQLALAFLNLYEMGRDEETGADRTRAGGREDQRSQAWLMKAKGLAGDLIRQSVPGYRGLCWGYPFDWQNVNGLMPKGTPHITATPYCYEVFARLADLTGDTQYSDAVRSVAKFVCEDLNDTPTGANAAAASYTPHDHGKVVNASAYRSFVLFDAARRFQNAGYDEKARKNLRFILQAQRSDGSWLYAIDNPAEAFIDHFHTCFVLKNLYKLNIGLRQSEVRRAIELGYGWYRKNLFDGDGLPLTFAVAPRLQIVHVEMYNVAEAISLGVLLRNDIPEAFTLAETLAARLIGQYGVPAGHWLTRVYRGGIKHKLPFIRWPQAQLFLAMTNLLTAMTPLRQPRLAAPTIAAAL